MNGRPYQDRAEAGRLLARELTAYARRSDVVVLGLPRGGVAVAYQIARALQAPLDVLVVRKLGVPWQAELAVGAIASGAIQFINQDLMDRIGITRDELQHVIARERQELDRRERAYRGRLPPPNLGDRTVILVDDGLATGATMRAAVAAVRQQRPARIIVAVPVAPPEVCEQLQRDADEVVCPLRPQRFYAISFWYRNFEQLADPHVRGLLRRAAFRNHGQSQSEVSL